jgi:hypothetical protein
MEHKGCDLTEVTRQCQLLLPCAAVPRSYNSIITSSEHNIFVEMHHTASIQIRNSKLPVLLPIVSLSMEFT